MTIVVSVVFTAGCVNALIPTGKGEGQKNSLFSKSKEQSQLLTQDRYPELTPIFANSWATFWRAWGITTKLLATG